MFHIMARESQIQQLDPCQTAAVQIVEGSDLQAVLTPGGGLYLALVICSD